MPETMKRSSLKTIKKGTYVNLERALKVDSRLGGHIVSGHIDGTGIIENIEKDENAIWYTIKADKNIIKYIVEKGSVALERNKSNSCPKFKRYFQSINNTTHTRKHKFKI